MKISASDRGHLRLCQQPRAAHTLRLDQHFFRAVKYSRQPMIRMSWCCDSGLVIVLIITASLMVCVALLLFYDFTDFCYQDTANNTMVGLYICVLNQFTFHSYSQCMKPSGNVQLIKEKGYFHQVSSILSMTFWLGSDPHWIQFQEHSGKVTFSISRPCAPTKTKQ